MAISLMKLRGSSCARRGECLTGILGRVVGASAARDLAERMRAEKHYHPVGVRASTICAFRNLAKLAEPGTARHIGGSSHLSGAPGR